MLQRELTRCACWLAVGGSAMARQRPSPSERVAALTRAAVDNEPYRQLIDSTLWEPICAVLDGMFYRSEMLFRQGQINAEQHRADMNAIESLRGTIEGGADNARKLAEEIIELEDHQKKMARSHLPGA